MIPVALNSGIYLTRKDDYQYKAPVSGRRSIREHGPAVRSFATRRSDQTSRDPKAFLSQRGEKGVHVLENDAGMLIRHDVTPVRIVDDHSRRQVRPYKIGVLIAHRPTVRPVALQYQRRTLDLLQSTRKVETFQHLVT